MAIPKFSMTIILSLLRRPLFIALLLSPTFLLTNQASADTVTLVADKWCPYNCTPGSESPGVLVEIAEYGLKKGGHNVSYSILPWARAIEETRAGRYSAVIGALPAEVPDFVYPTEGLSGSKDTLFVQKSSTWRYTDVKSLDKVSLGAVRDYSYTEEIDAYIMAHSKDPTRVQLSTGDDAGEVNIKKLLAGRVGVIVDDKYVVDYYLKSHSLEDKIISVAGIGEADDVYVAFSPASPKSAEYAKLVSEGFKELRSNGKMDEILAKYGLK